MLLKWHFIYYSVHLHELSLYIVGIHIVHHRETIIIYYFVQYPPYNGPKAIFYYRYYVWWKWNNRITDIICAQKSIQYSIFIFRLLHHPASGWWTREFITYTGQNGSRTHGVCANEGKKIIIIISKDTHKLLR